MVRPYTSFMDNLFPRLRAGHAIVSSQQLQIEHIDHPISVQIRLGRGGRIVVHPNRQRIELVDHVVAINIARPQRDARLRAGTSHRNRGRSFGTQEATGRRGNGVAAGRSSQAEGAIGIGSH